MKKQLLFVFAGALSLGLLMTSCKKETKEVPEYTITFLNDDQSELSILKVKEGVLPVYDKEEPTKLNTPQYSYSFNGWTPEIVAATSDATYVATYQETTNKYVVRFLNEDGTVLQKEELEYGAMPVYKGETPTKEATAQYSYTFLDWDHEIGAVRSNTTYTATFTSTTRSYQVTFETNGGTQIAPQTVEYGQCAERPTDPTKDATATTYYIFNGWDYDLTTPITGPTTVTANWIEVSPSSHGSGCVYIHYSQVNPTAESSGYREFWYCPLHDQYVLDDEPEAYQIVEAGSTFEGITSPTDPRYIGYKYDGNHQDLSVYSYGGDMFLTQENEFKTFRVTYHENSYDCSLYSEGDGFYLWRIDLPRIDYSTYCKVTMDVRAPDWNQANHIGPEPDQLTYQTVYSGNKDQGKITLSLKSTGLVMDFNSIEYASTLAFSRTFTDPDIINGTKSAYFYVENKWDRTLSIQNIVLSTIRDPECIYSYAGDTTKLSVVNGTVHLPSTKDYAVIGNGYGTDQTSLLVEGNANPGAAEVTLPLINFNQYTSQGEVRFKFGVKNNGEPMYFGAGDSKASLGTNSSTSESSNNNGYVNWEMVIRNNEAFVHNTYENHDYSISLTTGMRNGTESIVLSGGAASIYRRYLFVDFYLYF